MVAAVQKSVNTKRQMRGLAGWHRGSRAELIAAWYLRFKGYRVLARRWRCTLGEIDLIVYRRGVLAAVEVKARPNRVLGLEAIRPSQQQRLNAALEFYAARMRLPVQSMRLDALVICPRALPHHLPDAWRA